MREGAGGRKTLSRHGGIVRTNREVRLRFSSMVCYDSGMSEGQHIDGEDAEQPGVLAVKTENNHFIVTVRWVDGEKSELHFPTRGFPVVTPDTGDPLGRLTGEQALEIIRRVAAGSMRSEFSWAKHIKRE